MQLIDIDTISFEDIYKRDRVYYRDSFESGVRSALQYINNMPNVEPKKGEWILLNDIASDDYADMKCSCCGYTDCFESEHEVYKYCPECGAKMDGKD